MVHTVSALVFTRWIRGMKSRELRSRKTASCGQKTSS